jgi:hypothetical protein
MPVLCEEKHVKKSIWERTPVQEMFNLWHCAINIFIKRMRKVKKLYLIIDIFGLRDIFVKKYCESIYS